jgi:hypothetical protein
MALDKGHFGIMISTLTNKSCVYNARFIPARSAFLFPFVGFGYAGLG